MSANYPGDTIQDWVLDRVVGSGSFATVWKARKASGEKQSCAAVKVIATDKLSPKLKQSLECEVSILKRISHTNVVKLHEVAKVSNLVQAPFINAYLPLSRYESRNVRP